MCWYFGITPVRAAQVILVDVHGNTIAEGSLATLNAGQGQNAVVGFNDMAYFDALELHNRLKVTTATGVCSVLFDYPVRGEGIPQIGPATVNPLSATGATTAMTFRYSCSKSITDVLAGVTLCFNIGPSAVSGQISSHQMSFAGTPASPLNYQLYQDPGYTTVWGSRYQAGTTSPMVRITFLDFLPVTGSQTVYARLPGSQITTASGGYHDSYSAATVSVTINTGLVIPPTTCGTTVARQCNVSYANNINPGTVNPTQTNITANNTIGVAPAPLARPIPLVWFPQMAILQGVV